VLAEAACQAVTNQELRIQRLVAEEEKRVESEEFSSDPEVAALLQLHGLPAVKQHKLLEKLFVGAPRHALPANTAIHTVLRNDQAAGVPSFLAPGVPSPLAPGVGVGVQVVGAGGLPEQAVMGQSPPTPQPPPGGGSCCCPKEPPPAPSAAANVQGVTASLATAVPAAEPQGAAPQPPTAGGAGGSKVMAAAKQGMDKVQDIAEDKMAEEQAAAEDFVVTSAKHAAGLEPAEDEDEGEEGVELGDVEVAGAAVVGAGGLVASSMAQPAPTPGAQPKTMQEKMAVKIQSTAQAKGAEVQQAAQDKVVASAKAVGGSDDSTQSGDSDSEEGLGGWFS